MKNFSKRGNMVLDGLLILMFVFMFALFSITAKWFSGQLNTEIQADPDLANLSKTTYAELDSNLTGWIDNAFTLLVIILVLGVVLTSYMVDAHPAFIGIAILLLLVLIIVSMYVSNIYEEVATDELFLSTSLSIPKMHWILSHLPIIIFGTMLLSIGVLYAKTRIVTN